MKNLQYSHFQNVIEFILVNIDILLLEINQFFFLGNSYINAGTPTVQFRTEQYQRIDNRISNSQPVGMID